MFKWPNYKLFAATLLLVSALSFILYKCQAADSGVGFTITPPIFEITANPGDVKEESVSIFNNGPVDLNIVSTVENLKPMGEVGQTQVAGSEKDALPSLKDWIKTAAKPVSLKKGETKNIPVKIEIPANASPGSHFAAVLFSNNLSSQTDTTGSQVSQKVGALVLVTVSGEINSQAKILSIEPEKKFYWKNEPIKFKLRIANEGNVYIHPKGLLSASDIFGRKVDQQEIEGKNVLPGATRQSDFEYSPKRFFGRYTFATALTYGMGNQNKTMISSVGVTVIPLKETIIVLVILIVLLILRKRIWKAILVLVGKKK